MKNTAVKHLVCSLCLVLLMPYASAQDLSTLKDSLKISGSADARTVFYSSSGLQARRSPFSYVLGANVTFSKGEFSVPLSFTYSEQERSFSQPFNQFGIAPRYKWITTYLGYQNLSWGTYTLAGHQVLGAGFDLTPGKFTFGMIYGRLKRAVPFDSLKNEQQQPAYERRGLAMHIGYGTENDRIDITALKAKDNDKTIVLPLDSTGAIITPAENFAASVKGKLKLFKGMNAFAEAAVSAYNRNTQSAEIDEVDVPAPLKLLIRPNISSQVYTALNGGFNYQYKSFTLNGIYKRVAPDFQSMGAYFQENDVQLFGGTTAFAFAKSRCNVNAGLSHSTDNIMGKKAATTSRLMPIATFSCNAWKNFGFDVTAGNVITSQVAGNAPLSDTVRMNMQNPSLSFMPRWTMADTVKVRSLNMVIMRQWLQDNNKVTKPFSEYTNLNVNLNYSVSRLANFLTVFSSVNLNVMETVNGTGNMYGLSAGFSKGLKKNTFPVNASAGINLSKDNTTFNLSGGANYNIKSKHSFSLTLNVMQNLTEVQGQKDFRELTTVCAYSYFFNR